MTCSDPRLLLPHCADGSFSFQRHWKSLKPCQREGNVLLEPQTSVWRPVLLTESQKHIDMSGGDGSKGSRVRWQSQHAASARVMRLRDVRIYRTNRLFQTALTWVEDCVFTSGHTWQMVVVKTCANSLSSILKKPIHIEHGITVLLYSSYTVIKLFCVFSCATWSTNASS